MRLLRGYRECEAQERPGRGPHKNAFYPEQLSLIFVMDEDLNLKTRISGILELGDEDSKYFDPFIIGLILLNVAAMVLETVDWIYLRYASVFNAFEIARLRPRAVIVQDKYHRAFQSFLAHGNSDR